VLGVYFRGGYSIEMIWRERVAEVEARLKVAEQQSVEANNALAKKAEEKIKYIRGRTEYINQYIDKEVIRYDTKFMPGGVCEIPQEFTKAHNDAAEKPKK
jgi:homoserine trans-succinylase